MQDDRVSRNEPTGEREAGHSRSRSNLLSGLVALWIGAVVIGVGGFSFTVFLGDLGCEARVGDSNYGVQTWSWVPLGHGCKWTRADNGFDGTKGPGPLPSVYVGAIAIGAVALYAQGRRRAILRVGVVAAIVVSAVAVFGALLWNTG